MLIFMSMFTILQVVTSSFQRDWNDFASGSRLSKSKVVKESEKKDIHESNAAILNQMSDEKLEEKRREVLEELVNYKKGPEIVKMFMNRKRAPKRPRFVENIANLHRF